MGHTAMYICGADGLQVSLLRLALAFPASSGWIRRRCVDDLLLARPPFPSSSDEMVDLQEGLTSLGE